PESYTFFICLPDGSSSPGQLDRNRPDLGRIGGPARLPPLGASAWPIYSPRRFARHGHTVQACPGRWIITPGEGEEGRECSTIAAVPSQLELPALAVAGLVAGTINVLAGGGSFLTLPLLLFLGLPAAVANGTNRVGVLAQN